MSVGHSIRRKKTILTMMGRTVVKNRSKAAVMATESQIWI